jgi:predicted transglutaminase-like cysteine proteinase
MFRKTTARTVAMGVSFAVVVMGHPARAIDASRVPQGQGPAHIELGERVVPPFAYSVFCHRAGYHCGRVPAADGFTLTAQRMVELGTVNRRVNRRITYRSDIDATGREDRWDARVPRGDCEDYALTKREELIDLGWPSRRLLIALGVTEEGTGHVVIVVRLDDRDLILDNLTDRILPWHATTHRYLKVQSPADPEKWHAPAPRAAA